MTDRPQSTRSLPSDDEALALAGANEQQIRGLMARAAAIRDRAWGSTLTFSPKVFLPITNLCRDRCDYCAFRRSPGDPGERTMSPNDVARALADAAVAGCGEALLCLGDRPETAFESYRRTLAVFGHLRTVDYLVWVCKQALGVGLLPHTNAGVLHSSEMRLLKPVNASLGLMLETASRRLCARGMAHHRAPDKRPELRLAMIRQAGELSIPFTTGILVGIGETRRERVEALLAIRALHLRYGHIQEVIIQNFTPHEGTLRWAAPLPGDDDMALAVALARTILPDDVSIQSPPNLNPERTALLVNAGINDFGGISTVTPDFINPNHPWPEVQQLEHAVVQLGYELRPRLCIYDGFIERAGFVDPSIAEVIRRARARLAHFERRPSKRPERIEQGAA